MPFTPIPPNPNRENQNPDQGHFVPFPPNNQQSQQQQSHAPAAMSASSHILTSIANFGIGAVKGTARTAENIGGAVESGLDETLGRGINEITGHGNTPTQTGAQTSEFSAKHLTDNGNAQKAGDFAAQATQFFVPGLEGENAATAAGDAMKAASPIAKNIATYLTKRGAEGAQAGATTAAQTGSAKEGVDAGLITAVLGVPVDGAIKTFQSASKELAPKFINSLIKPLLKDFSYGKNPGRAVAQEGITANSLDELGQKIGEARQTYGKKIQDLGQKIGDSVKGTLEPAFAHIDAAIEKANVAPRTNASLIERLKALKSDLLGEPMGGGEGTQSLKDLTYGALHEFKQKIGDMTKWTGNASDDKAVNAALKKAYGAAKEEMNTIADKVGLGKDARFLNERYADLTSAHVATEYRDKIAERQNLISAGSKHLGTAAGVLGALATGGAALPAILAGVAGTAFDKIMGTAAAKTRIAKWLAGVSKEDAEKVFEQAPHFRDALVRAGYTAKGEIGKLLSGDINEPGVSNQETTN